MMDLLSQFTHQLRQRFPALQKQHKLLLAVSGGADSVALTDLFSKTGYDFAIAHCNFQLRGEESERDEKFVRSLAGKYDKSVFVKKFDTATFATVNKLSTQLAARELRYNWFEELSTAENISFIVTAHHANDNAETLLMNFFRGTGLKGLTGIPAQQKNIIRPLLGFKKETILDYIKEEKLDFVEDSSNESAKYTRNFFRNELLPAISKVFPNVESNLLHTIARLKETNMIYEETIRSTRDKLFLATKNGEQQVPILRLKKLQPATTWLWELFKDFGCSPAQLPELTKLLDADNGSFLDTTSHRIIRNRRWLIITTNTAIVHSTISITQQEKNIKFPAGELVIEQLTNDEHFKISKDNSIALIDLSTIKFPLLLRQLKKGDYFYPLGMQKKKKISRFMIDQKFSKTQKENTWVLESNKKIAWVVGHRIDDRFRITPKTTAVLKLRVH